MKANEFVKKFGWARAKEVVDGAGDHHRYFIADAISVTYSKYGDCCDSVDDLKRLVESYELVEIWGGLEYIDQAIQITRYPSRLKQAALDVESCL